jgi:UDP-N-acetylglucosamine 2-epimerase (non-hydrolysing)
VKLLHVVGARPNFPKLAPVHRAGAAAGLEQVVVHTGQHYDERLSGDFFAALGIPEPTHRLEVGSASHAVQTARIMERIEPVLLAERPDWVVVYGDVNSTMAAALVAVKLGARIAHVEAGLRSHDWRMPEEVNRVVTDRIASLLLTPSRDTHPTLRQEGVPDACVVFVGNVMVDTLLATLQRLGLAPDGPEAGADDSVVVTLHRPSNVDDPARLAAILLALDTVAETRPVHFPVHPRTAARIAEFGLTPARVTLSEPAPYETLLRHMVRARVVVTDSGGVQEETTAMGIPCLTLRDNTERPITVTEGTNQLVRDPAVLPALVAAAARPTTPKRPDGWDGAAGPRVIAALQAFGGVAGGGRP